jgi:hypothetical protein
MLEPKGLAEEHAALLGQVGALRHVLERLISPGYGFVLVVARLEREGDFTTIALLADASDMPDETRRAIHGRMADPEKNAELIAEVKAWSKP